MTDLIRSLTAWLGLLSKPGGRHRAAVFQPRPTFTAPPSAPGLPVHRSPYGLPEHLDGAATVAVRPYVTAHEQRQRPGTYWIHGMEVA